MTAALSAGQWMLDRQRQQQEKVPERLLTDGYFEAMADDIESRRDEGLSLEEALREVYGEQGPVLLRPAPKPRGKSWLIPVSVGAAAVILALAYRKRR
jgi:hypothetical protein